MIARRAPTGDRPLTIEEFERLPDDGYRDELVRGWVVREPPPGAEHGGVATELSARLRNFVREHHLGRIVSDSGFILAETPPTVRAPDIAFITTERIPPAGLPVRYFPGSPDLAVEIVSPSNTPAAIQAKVDDYLAAGTRVVWVVEPRARTVTVYRPDHKIRMLREDDELDGGEVLPGFRVGVRAIFEG
jgi:Uma2 family endonuclease